MLFPSKSYSACPTFQTKPIIASLAENTSFHISARVVFMLSLDKATLQGIASLAASFHAFSMVHSIAPIFIPQLFPVAAFFLQQLQCKLYCLFDLLVFQLLFPACKCRLCQRIGTVL